MEYKYSMGVDRELDNGRRYINVADSTRSRRGSGGGDEEGEERKSVNTAMISAQLNGRVEDRAIV